MRELVSVQHVAADVLTWSVAAGIAVSEVERVTSIRFAGELLHAFKPEWTVLPDETQCCTIRLVVGTPEEYAAEKRAAEEKHREDVEKAYLAGKSAGRTQGRNDAVAALERLINIVK